MKPIILINVKCYENAIGERLPAFVEALTHAEGREKARIILAVPATDLLRVRDCPFELFGQHVEGMDLGSHTGHIHPLLLKQAGASGSLLNHAEHRQDTKQITQAIESCNLYGLDVCLCADTPARGSELAQLAPTWIAIEPPDLIGGEVSISRARPEVITESLDRIRTVRASQNVLVGAGIKDAQDFKVALGLGTQGILLASGIVKHNDPAVVLSDLLSIL